MNLPLLLSSVFLLLLAGASFYAEQYRGERGGLATSGLLGVVAVALLFMSRDMAPNRQPGERVAEKTVGKRN